MGVWNFFHYLFMFVKKDTSWRARDCDLDCVCFCCYELSKNHIFVQQFSRYIRERDKKAVSLLRMEF